MTAIALLNTLGRVDDEVRPAAIGGESPDLPGVGDVPSVLVGEDTCSELEVVTRPDLALLDGLGKLLLDRLSLDL